jgi:hypothetical protein
MSYQQWKPLSAAPLEKWVAVNTGGYIMRGMFVELPGVEIACKDWRGRVHRNIETWSWSDQEPEAEMLMVKPHGIFMAHWWNELGHLLNIVHDFDVRLFVEIGLLDGGLTSVMMDECRWNSRLIYVGVSLTLHYLDPRVVELAQGNYQVTLLEKDAWENTTIGQVISQATATQGRWFVYCDGGDKAKEAHLYWPMLRPGDLLGLHDYSDDPLEKGPEVFPNDVADLLEQGKRIGRHELKDTRILLLEKP